MVLFLPGEFCDRRCWERVELLLAEHAEIDHIGPLPFEPTRTVLDVLRAYEETVLARIAAVAPGRRLLLAGVSLGAFIAARVASRVPAGRIEQILLYGGLVRLPDAIATTRQQLADVLERGEIDTKTILEQLDASVAAPEERDEVTNRVMTDIFRAIAHDELLWHLRGLDPMVRDYVVEPFDVPSIIVHARGDQAVPFACGEELAAQCPRAHLVPMDLTSHFLPLTHSSEVAKHILAVIDGAGGS